MSSEALEAAVIALQVTSGVAIFCNLVVVAIFAAFKQLRSTYYGFLFNLVLADIATATLAIVYQYHPSKVPTSLSRTSFCASELSILAVAVNRLLAFSMPRDRFRAVVTCGRMVAACVLIWVASAAIYVPLTYVEKRALWLLRPLLALMIILITAVVYYLVFRKISQYSAALSVYGEDEERRNRVRQTRHLLVTFTIILTTSFFCWLPYCIGNFIIYSSNTGHCDQSINFKVFYKSSVNILVMNSVINPFIYWWRVGEFRNGLRRVFFARRNKKNENPELETMAFETLM